MATSLLAIAATASAPPGYVKSTVALEAPPVGLAFDSTGVLYALQEPEFNSNQTSLREILPSGVIANSFTITGDNSENFFVGGMTYDPVTDRLLITDNTADGRIYAVSKSGVQETIATDIPAIAVPIVRDTGEIFVSTALGSNIGEVLSVDRTTGVTTPVVGGLDYGAGLAFDAAGDLIIQEADHGTLRGRYWRLPMANPSGALIPLLDDTNSSYGITIDTEGDLFATGKDGLYEIVGNPAAEVLIYSDGATGAIATAIAFDPGLAPFEPFAGPNGGRLAINANFGHATNDLFVTILTPTVPGDYDGNGDVNAADYAVWKSAYGTNDPYADGNLDGIVDAVDYTVWRNHLGLSLGSGGIAAPIVPEPSASTLASLTFVFVLGWAVRKRSMHSFTWRYCS
jgi:hypothetical protein